MAANNLVGGNVANQPISLVNASAQKKKTNIIDAKSTVGKKRQRNDMSDSDTDEDECGAFNQPAKLARFMKSIGSLEAMPIQSIDTILQSDGNIDEDARNDKKDKIEPSEPRQRSLEERCSTQICRNWLKHTFLSLGKACKANPCPRLHQLPEQSQRLYSDYSFKGLQSKQQKVILSSYKKKSINDEGVDIVVQEESLHSQPTSVVKNQ